MKITKETIRRAARTFVQAVISYIAVNVVVIDFSEGKEVAKSAVIGLCVSAIAAGIAAIMNLDKDSKEADISKEEEVDG